MTVEKTSSAVSELPLITVFTYCSPSTPGRVPLARREPYVATRLNGNELTCETKLLSLFRPRRAQDGFDVERGSQLKGGIAIVVLCIYIRVGSDKQLY